VCQPVGVEIEPPSTAISARITGVDLAHLDDDSVHPLGRANGEHRGRTTRIVDDAEHPVVRTHPGSGRRCLYVNRGLTRRIVGLAPVESDALLELLFRHCERPEFQVRYEWAVGDVAIWDERPTLHDAVADHFPPRREMARATAR